MEEESAGLSLLDDEEEAFQEEAGVVDRNYQVQNGENPLVLTLNFTEFWVQVHELPPSLMTETMAKQFGDFLGKFLDYDTSIPIFGLKKYMRIRVCLDVSASLKRKKKIQIGTDMTVYARFKYEKLRITIKGGAKPTECSGEQVAA
ncbi:hypothetical protein GOBAR_AA28087 [Gossypium barbadense]|uniref:Uncharacterized protein n=1 Tax=Gossypium barbadense TaxID=3634 RepID=A0A2P5WNC6_GOSBA|nr:hypothetical protein GOBAR_AA28087 [Gossypium barbadense]